MLIEIAASTFDRLVEHPHARANAIDPHEIGATAVWLHTDMGPSYFLTRDGRILVTDAFEPSAGARSATDDECVMALVLGARNLSAPELLFLLPQQPASASTCLECSGTRWSRLPIKATDGSDVVVICLVCSGRGCSRPTQ